MLFKQVRYLCVILICLSSFNVLVFSSMVPFDSLSGCEDNSLYITGEGKVSVQPDIAIISVGITIIDKSSELALQTVAQKINQISQILSNNNISKSDIETQSISIYPQYNYSDNKQQLVGQSAQQTLSAKVRRIDPDGRNLGQLIDELAKVDGIQFSGIRFDKDDIKDAQKQSRKLAFQNAKQKAIQFALLAGRTLGKLLTVLDTQQSALYPAYDSQTFFAKNTPSTTVTAGLLDISFTIMIKYSLR